MPNPNLTEIVVILDRSGSMASIKTDVIGGYDKFVADQKAAPGECVLTLVQFDSQGIDTVLEAKPIHEVPSLVLQPRDLTPLLDAMGRTITQVGDRLSKTAEDKRPQKVIVLVITDGVENASKEYSRAQIKAMVEHQQKAYNWVFSYLGANVDAFQEAGAMGISATSSATYSANRGGVKHAFATASGSVGSYRSASPTAMASTFRISDEDRVKMMVADDKK